MARPRAMLTLTVSSNHYDTPDDAAAALKRGLRLLRLRLKRHPRLVNFSFLAIFEAHKSGYPHLHLLIRGKFIPWEMLTKWWEEITGSTHVDIRKIDTTGKAAFYVAKYLGKDLHAFAGCKRWWRSHGYSEGADEDYAKDRPNVRWTRYGIDFDPIAYRLASAGYRVSRVGPDRIAWKPAAIDDPPPPWLYVATAGMMQ